MESPRKRRKSITMGFTLIELVLVVAIIGPLAAIAIPKFANLVVRAKEASIKAKLGSLRSVLSIYYSDNEGNNFGSASLDGLVPKYIDEIQKIANPTVPAHVMSNGSDPARLDIFWTFGAPWGYDPGSGTLVISCTHTDTKGSTWSLY